MSLFSPLNRSISFPDDFDLVHDFGMDRVTISCHRRGFNLQNFIERNEDVFRRAIKLIDEMRKEIDYYLDAIWC